MMDISDEKRIQCRACLKWGFAFNKFLNPMTGLCYDCNSKTAQYNLTNEQKVHAHRQWIQTLKAKKYSKPPTTVKYKHAIVAICILVFIYLTMLWGTIHTFNKQLVQKERDINILEKEINLRYGQNCNVDLYQKVIICELR